MNSALRLIVITLLAAALCALVLLVAPAYARTHDPARVGYHRTHSRSAYPRVPVWHMTPPGDGIPVKWLFTSFYGGGERLNAHTANGERFVAGGFTAAHRALPFGTRLRVCLHGCAVVRVNDRGPAAWTGRSLDLSRGAAQAIGLTGPGVAAVRVSRL